MAGASLRARTSRLSWWTARIYLIVLSLAALGAAAYVLRFWVRRGPYFELLSQARETDWKVFLMVAAPIVLSLAAIIGGVILIFAFKRKGWSLVASAVAAPATIAALYLGARMLRENVGVYYDDSRYFDLYRLAALPLAGLSLLFLVLLLADVVVVTRNKPAASEHGA